VPDRSRLEDLTIPAAGLLDSDLDVVAGVAAQLAAGEVAQLPRAARLLFADLAAQACGLVAWRAQWFDLTERLLAESDGED